MNDKETQTGIKAENPPQNNGTYLAILKSTSRSNHAKTFAGCGKPEIAFRNNNKWYCRGTLKVAYWLPIPKFEKKYVLGPEGEQARWE